MRTGQCTVWKCTLKLSPLLHKKDAKAQMKSQTIHLFTWQRTTDSLLLL